MDRLQSSSMTPWWRSWRIWLLAALAGQYVVLQLATGVEYFDAPRNLHWGQYLLEQPRFLLDAEDVYDRINGFPPTSAELAPAGAASGHSAPLHPWWGPLYLLLFAGVWGITGSYTALQLVVPLAAGAVVVLTYAFGRRYFGERTGLLAAALLALLPVYRENGAISFVEPISALLLALALWAFLERRTALAATLGALVMLGKIDLIALYFGTIAAMALPGLRDRTRQLPRRHVAACLVAPLSALLPWLYLHYIFSARPLTVAGGPNLATFGLVAPLMLDQLFTLQPLLTLPTLGLLGVVVGVALWGRAGASPLVYRMLAAWLALGCLVLLLYTATPGASNNPRVLIPALPALCLLAADGLERLLPRLRQAAVVYLLAVFLAADGAGLWYQALQARALQATRPAWRALEQAPRGLVLTEDYWFAILYARQPATWFAHDPAFQRNILLHLGNFERYIAAVPIRYVVLPRDQQQGPAYKRTPAVALYSRLPFGRELGWASEPLTSPEVRAFLEQRFPQQVAGDFVIFTLDPR